MTRLPLTWANVLTLLRMAVIPYICCAMWMSMWGTALSVFIVASITDMLDGWCARALHQETVCGQYIDPIADKLMMMSCYAALAFHTHIHVLPTWFFYVVCGKEIVLGIGSVYMWDGTNHKELMPTLLGKIAMVLQVVLLVWILGVLHWHIHDVYYISYMMWCALIVIGSAFFHYVYRAIQLRSVSCS